MMQRVSERSPKAKGAVFHAAATLLAGWLALVPAPAQPGDRPPPSRGHPMQAQRAPDVTVSQMPPLEPGAGLAPAQLKKPTAGRLRGGREFPTVHESQPAVGVTRRQAFTDASTTTTSGGTVSLAGFQPADAGPSPATSASFQGVLDDGTTYNPDPSGAVGTNHIMTVTASAVQILSRSGTQLSLTTLSNFWSNLGDRGHPKAYDPRVLYDPAAHRWITVATANPGLTNPGILLAISQTSDPTAAWYRYFLPTDSASDIFADSPNLGLNRDSIVISANMFDRTNYFYASADIFVLRKAPLYAGTATPEILRFSRNDIGPPANIPVPAVVFDDTLTTNYLVGNWNGDTTNGGFLAVYTLATNNGALELALSAFSRELPFGSPPWDAYSPDDYNFAPQSGTTNRIYLGDARIGNVVFRVSPDASTLFLAQTIFLPAGGSATRAAVQWWEVTVNGVVIQRGRIEDTATGRHFAYPSIAVNRRNDLLVGYSRFGPAQFPSANYSFRIDADLFSSLRGDVVLKAGEAKFEAPDDFGLNHWGDWSATVVDPNDDTDLWTLQEYASSPADGIDRWGTWWGRVSPPSDLSVLATDSPDPVVAGSNVTYSVTVITTNNKIQRVTGVSLQAPLPAGAILVSATPSQGSCGLTNGIISCAFGTVGDSGRVTASLVVRHLTNGSPIVTFTAAANGQELTPLNNTVSVTTTVLPAADLAVVAGAAPNPVTVSNQVVYTLLVTNQGPNSATTLQLTNALPANTAFLAATPSQGACAHNAGVVACNLGTVGPLGFVTVQITARPNAAGNLTNRVSVGSASVDTQPANNVTLVTTLANASPTLGFISDRSINEDSVLGPISFAVGDFETPAGNLLVTGFSSNPATVPNANIVFGGSGSNRTVTVTPSPNANGVVSITRIVTDALGATATNSFQLTILPVNDSPTITAIAAFSMDEDTTTNVAFTISDIETPAALLTVLGASSNPALIPNASLAFGGSGANRTVTLTPAANQFGSSTITITVSDGTNTASTALLVTVRDVNDPPSISGLANRSVAEDASTGPIAFTVADIETPAAALVVSGFSGNPALVPNSGLLFGGTGGNRTLTVLPATNQFGVVTLYVVATDTNNASNTNAFDLTITPVNDPPTLGPIADRTVNEGSAPQSVPLTGISSGASNELQGVTVIASSSNPALIPAPTIAYGGGSTGLLTFSLVPGANGTATITVTATDDGGTNNIATRSFVVTVLPVNDPPILLGLLDRTISEDGTAGPYAFTVGDPETAATALTVSGVSSDQALVPNANISFSGAGSNRFVTIVPAANLNGSCRITVTVSDGQVSTNASFLLTVLAVNDPPTLSGLAARTLDEDSSTNLVFTVSDVESPASVLTVTAFSSNPTLLPGASLVISGTGPSRTLSLVPATNQFGSATITLTVTDPDGGTNSASFVLTVNPVNDPPAFDSVADVVISEDSGTQVLVLTGVTSGAPNEVQSLSFSVTSSAPSVVPNPLIGYTNGNATAWLRFTPVTNASGDAVLTVTLDDGAASNRFFSRSFTVRVLPVNDPPLLGVPGPQTMTEDSTLALNLFVSDVEAPAGVTLAVQSSNPEVITESGLTLAGTGTNRTLTLRPLTNAFGSAEILLTATDSEGAISSASFELQVLPVNDPPSISGIASITNNEDTISAPLPFTIVDPETPGSVLTLTASSSNPGLIPVSGILLSGSGNSRVVRILPATNQSGVASVTLSVSDGLLSATTSFQVTVLAVNDSPFISDIPDVVVDEDAPIAPLAFVVSDVESAASTLTIFTSSSDASLVPNGSITVSGSSSNRTLTLSTVSNASGTCIITVTVSDGVAASSDSFVLTVRPANDPPTVVTVASVGLTEDGATSVSVTVGDVESPAGSLVLSAVSSNPTLLPPVGIGIGGTGALRTVTLVPAADQFGTATVTFTVTDPDGGTNTASMVVTVNGVNDPPTLAPIGDVTLNEDAGAQVILLTGVGMGAANEGQTLVFSAVSSAPGVVPNPTISYTNGTATAVLRYAPVTNAFGDATVTVTLNDGGASNNVVTRSFLVRVLPVNDLPVLGLPGPQTMLEDATLSLNVYVNDVEAPAALLLAASSSNPSLFPTNGISVSGSGTNRTLFLQPSTNRSGTAQIALTLTDSDGAVVSNTFSVVVTAVNDPPVIAPIANLSLAEDSLSPLVPVVVDDPDTSSLLVTLTAFSSNPALLPPGAILLGGRPGNRTVQFLPATNQFGVALVTLVATDGTSTTSNTFQVTVQAVNDAPTISDVADQVVDEDTTTGALPLTVGDVDNAATALTMAGASSDATLVPPGNIVFTGSASSRAVTITPAANSYGTCTITLTVSDGQATATDSFVVTVRPVNDRPTITAPPVVKVNEDGVTNVTVTVGDVETPAGSLVLSAVSSNPTLLPLAGISLGGSGAARIVTLTPAADQFGTATVTFTVTDPDGGTNTASMVVTVNGVNDPPTLAPIEDVTLNEDAGPQVVVLSGVGMGASNEGQTLVFSAVSSAPGVVPNPTISYTNGTATAVLRYAPVTNAFGDATVTVTLNDGGASNNVVTRAFLVRVLPVNDLPVLGLPGPQTMLEDAALTLNVTVSDVETPAGITLSAQSSNDQLIPESGILFGGSGTNRTMSLRPLTNAFGTVQITVRATDADGGVSSGVLQVEVTPVNDAPVLSGIANQVLNEDSPSGDLAFTVQDAETAASALVVGVSSSNPSLLTPAGLVLGGSGTNRTLRLLPGTNQFGVAQVTLTLGDGVLTVSNTFQVTVQAVNDAPVISDVPDQAIDEDTTTGALSLTVGDVDNAATVLTLAGASSDAALVPAGNIVFGGSGSNRTVTVTPATNANGTCTITLTVSDGQATATDSFVLTVRPVNDRPVITSPASVALNEDGVTNVTVTVGDVETPAGSLMLSAVSSNPTLLPLAGISLGGSGAARIVTLTPAADQFGTATVVFTVADPEGATNTASLMVTVNGVNDPPTLGAIGDVTINEDAGPQVMVLTGVGMGAANEGQTLVFSAVSSAPGVVPNPTVSYTNGSGIAVLRYAPVTNAFGDATVTVALNDGGASNNVVTRSFLVRVLPVNDLPVLLVPSSQTMLEDATLTVNLLVDDVEGAGLVTLAGDSTNPSLIDTGGIQFAGTGTNRSLTLQPRANAFGTAQIILVATDGGGASVTNSFQLQVQPVNDAPIVSSVGNQSINEDTLSPDIAFTVADVDTNAASLAVTATSSNPLLFPSGNLQLSGTGSNRTLRVLPATNQSGTATLTLTVSDGFLSGSTSFQLTVLPVNDLPTISDIADRAIGEDTLAGPISFTVADVETAANLLTVTVNSSDLTLVPLTNIVLSGSGSNRAVQVTPAPNRFGVATITLQVTDAEGGVASDSFVLTVNPVNDPPTMAAIPDLSTNEDAGTLIVGFSGISAGPFESQVLSITATSSNPALIPSVAVNYSSPATIGSLVFTCATNAVGSAVITVTVRDDGTGSNTLTRSFTVTVTPVNDPPTLNPIADRSFPEDSSTTLVTVSGISAGPPDEVQTLVLSAVSSNPSVLPNPVVSFTSPGPTGSLQLTPVPNAAGTALITVTVAEAGGGLSVQRSFTVTVTSVNDAPTLAGPGPIFLPRSVPTNVIVAVADIDDAVSTLTLVAASSNPALLPAQNLVFSGSGAQRNLSITPVTNRFGSAQVTLTVTDSGGLSTSTNFTVTVSSTGLPPTLSPLGSLTSAEDTSVIVPFTVGDFETPPGGLMITAVSSNLALLPATGLTLGGTAANRTLTALPRTNQTGVTLITLTVFDPEGLSVTNSFVLTVTNVNDLPTLGDLPNRTLTEDVPSGPLPFSIGDIESPETSLLLTFQSSNPGLLPPGNILLGGSGANRTVALTPAPDQSGTGTITLLVVDPDGGTNSRSFTVTVNPVNDSPTLGVLTSLTLVEDAGPQVIPLAGISAGGGESQPLLVTAASSNPALIPAPLVTYTSPQATGSLTLTPTANVTGTSLITVTVNDGGSSNNLVTRSFLVTVNPVNDPPFVSPVADQQSAEDTPLTVALAIGDLETPAALLLVSASAADATLFPAANLQVSGGETNRTLTLIPAPNRFGTTTVSVAVSDGSASNVTTFTVGVFAVNDAPTLNPLTNALYTTSPGALSLPLTGLGPGGTNEPDTLTLSVSNNLPGTFWQAIPAVSYSGGTTGVLTFRPASNQNGTGTVAVIVNDGRGSNNLTVRTFLLAVRASANTQPFITAIGPQSVNEDGILGPISFTIGDAATPASNLLVSVTSSNQSLIPNSGLSLGGTASNRTLTITPAPNASGSSILSLLVLDSAFAFTNLNFTVTVNPVNDPPAISSISNHTVLEDAAPLPIAFNVSDVETLAGALTVSATSANTTLIPPANLVLGGSGSNRILLVSPAPNQSGSSLITVTVSDGVASTNTSFTLTVTATNDPPTLSDLLDLTLGANSSSGPVAFTVGDVDTAPGSLTLSAASSNTGLVPVSNVVFGGSGAARTLTVIPATNQSGTATITVTVSDGAATASDTFQVTVLPSTTNAPPTLAPIADVTLNQGAPPFAVALSGITAGGGETQPLALAASSSNPSVIPHPTVTYTSPNATGSLTLRPAAGTNGSAVITVTVSDCQSSNALATRTFTVTVNGAPVVSPIPNQVLAQGGASSPIPFTVRDPETAASGLTLAAVSSNPTLISTSGLVLGGSGTNRTLTLTPAAGQSGFATLTVTATDPQGNSQSSSFLLTVVPAQEPPRLSIELTVGQLVISWPSTAGPNWALQVSTNLSNAVGWRLAPDTAVLVGDRYRVTNSLAGPLKFYRLCQGCAAARALPAAPALALARTPQGLTLSWPAEASSFVLESQTGAGAPWVKVSALPVELNGQWLIDIPADAPLQIFRLRLPD